MNGKIIEKIFNITTLNRQRKVRIFLPYDYNHSDKNYPVMYMHDGQNLFSDETSYAKHSWGVTRKFNNKDQIQLIIVGIDNGEIHRFNEYSPFEPNEYSKALIYENSKLDSSTGEGTLYMKWLVEELKPYIDANYRTKADFNNTLLVGSSMGGLISMYGGLLYREVFGGLGVLSPAFWYCKEAIFEYVRTAKQYKGKIFMSVGTTEDGLAEAQHYLNDVNDMSQILYDKNINNQIVIVDQGKHNELFWEELLIEMTDYFFD